MIRTLLLLAALLTAQPAAAGLPGDSVYQLNSRWSDQDGHAAPLASQSGRYVLVAMIYTHCKDVCPMTVESMRKIAAEWGQRSDLPLRLVLVSFDSQRDRPEVLRQFAASHALAPDSWTLLQGDRHAVRQLAAALGVNYQQMANGDWNHANLVTLLDRQGRILLQQAGFNEDGSDVLNKAQEAEGQPRTRSQDKDPTP